MALERGATGRVVPATLADYMPPRRTALQQMLRFARTKPLGTIGLAMVVFMVVMAAAAPWIALYPPKEIHARDRLQGYGRSEITGNYYILGADHFGRDTLARVMYGTRVSLLVGFTAMLLGGIPGGILGIASGYFSGKFDIIVQRVADVKMAFPGLILALAVVAVLSPSQWNVTAAIAFGFWPGVNRITRSNALSVRERQYVDAARSLGYSDARIILRHVLPNCAAPWLIVLSAEIGAAILAESGLSFLGLGIGEPNPSLGNMLSGASQSYLEVAPWMAIWPGFAIMTIVFGVNVFGDALRDAWDPRLRRGQR